MTEETYFGKVRLRSSLTNCGLPVLTGRLGSLAPAAAPSVCLLPPRRLRTEKKGDTEKKYQQLHYYIKVNQRDHNNLRKVYLLTDGPWVT